LDFSGRDEKLYWKVQLQVISYGRHSINSDDVAEVINTLTSDWLTIGPKVEEFEKSLEEFTKAPTLVVSSGTAALHCAFAAIQLTSGDEVITPPITFIATQATAALFGAKIVFADVLPDTGNIDPAEVEKVITPRTKAIVAVDYAGHPADLDELRDLASRNGIYLIEDAAHSFGSRYRGKYVGSIADITTFSFFPTKNITTGEGGALASIDPELLKRARLFSRQGLVKDSTNFQIQDEGIWHQEVHEFGLNYRLSDISCALGISQLRRFEEFRDNRDKIFGRYKKNLEHIEGVKLPTKRDYVEPFWHLFPILVDPEYRENLFEFMHSREIKVQVNYLPAHLHPVFKKFGFKKGDFPVSENFYNGEVSLPIYSGLTESEVDLICETVHEFYEQIL
jgi:dTDP-4-amino-4,6-dideoxygalactose transaminase